MGSRIAYGTLAGTGEVSSAGVSKGDKPSPPCTPSLRSLFCFVLVQFLGSGSEDVGVDEGVSVIGEVMGTIRRG